MALSLILPCFNPQQGWERNVVNAYNAFCERIGEQAELIVVADGVSDSVTTASTDWLRKQIPKLQFISYAGNRGKGYAIRQGVAQATGELLMYTDIDFPYKHESFLKIYAALKSGNTDLAIGIRGSEYYTHLPQARVRISKILRWFIKKFLRIPTDDTQCGLKGFNQKGKEVFLQTTINRYLFDLEFIFLAARKKLSIKTVEVELRPEIVLSKMNWKILMQEFGNFLKIFVRSVIG